MKKIIFAVAFFIVATTLRGQQSVQLSQDLAFIIDDAAKGFQQTFKDLDEVTVYGRYYNVNKAIFGLTDKAYLSYSPPKEQTKYAEAVDEKYFFGQLFKPGEPSYKIVKDSLEIILDATAAKAGLKKTNVKPPKDFKGAWTEYQYAINDKIAVKLKYDNRDKGIRLMIFSPYRPADVPPPQKTLGCIVISLGSFVYKYVSPVYGEATTDIRSMDALAARAFRASAISDSDYQYTWYPNKTFYDIQKMFKKPIVVQEIGGVTAK